MAHRSPAFAGPLLAFLTLPGALSAQPPAVAGNTFSESMVIREREILIDLPEEFDSVEPKDFRVLVDGRPREAVRAERAGGDWTLVVYVDQVLARPGTVFYSGLALASHARDLTALGDVEVVVAGADPGVVLAPTRDAKRLTETLTGLSATARVERDRSEGQAGGSGEPSVRQAARQLDKLLAFLADRRPAGPHAVLLIADGAGLSPEQTALLESREPAAPGTPAFVFRRAARLLAAYGWVTIPVPLRKEGAGRALAPKSEIEIFRGGAAPSNHQNGVPPILPGKAPRATTLAFPGVVDLFVKPRTASLRTLSQATAGTVIGFETQIAPVLAALSRRWRLWLAEPDGPVDGGLHPIEVALPDRRSVEVPFYAIDMNVPGRTKKARTPAWIRSSTPREIAEARLEGLLAGRAAPAGLRLTATLKRTPAGLELAVEVAPFPAPESAPPGPLRVSWAFAGEEGAAAVHHETVAADPAKGFRRTFQLDPPAAAGRLAVTAEALGPESWAGRVLEAP